MGGLQSFYHAEAKPHGWTADPPSPFVRHPYRFRRIVCTLQSAIPIAPIHLDRSHFDAMLSCVSHDLCWRIKSHRLAVEQRAAEGRRVIPFDPRAGINKQRE